MKKKLIEWLDSLGESPEAEFFTAPFHVALYLYSSEIWGALNVAGKIICTPFFLLFCLLIGAVSWSGAILFAVIKVLIIIGDYLLSLLFKKTKAGN